VEAERLAMNIALNRSIPQVLLGQVGDRGGVLEMRTSHWSMYPVPRISRRWKWPLAFCVEEVSLGERFAGEVRNWWPWWKRFWWRSADLVPVLRLYQLESGEEQQCARNPGKHLKSKHKLF
jgi:hypothetical protein